MEKRADEQEWKVRDGNKQDLEKIIALRKIVFGLEEEDKLDPKFWQWEFIGGVDGQAYIYVVDHRDKIIGHFADLPRRFSIGGRVVHGTLSLDLMVHPDYRRKGLFTAMGKYGVQRVKENQGVFMTAFPIRSATIYGLKRIGWKEIMRLPVLVYPIRFSGIAGRYFHFLPINLMMGGVARILYDSIFYLNKRETFHRKKIERVMEWDDEFEVFSIKAISLFSNMGMRDRTYMEWRYLRHPTRNYIILRAVENGTMRGFIILRKVNLLGFNSAVIVDLMAFDEDSLNSLVGEGIAYSRREGVHLLGIMVPEPHPYYPLLKKRGFLRSPKTFRFMIYSNSEDKSLLNPNRWFVTWGDTDVI